MDIVTALQADTTGGPRWSPVVVTAHLASSVVNLDTNPLHLDGPLSWGAYQAHRAAHGVDALPPMTDESAADFALPLATWSEGGTWGWACSRGTYHPTGYATLAMRRRPAVDEMARLSPDKKHHLAAGSMKARDTPLPATLVPTVTWFALAEVEPLRALLDRVWSLGKHGRHGHGRISHWTVEEHPDRDAWKDRVMPAEGGRVQGIRAPYYHSTRQVPAC